MKKLFVMMLMLVAIMSARAQQAISSQELSDRLQIRELVDRYATESDKFNKEGYAEIFAKDLTALMLLVLYISQL